MNYLSDMLHQALIVLDEDIRLLRDKMGGPIDGILKSYKVNDRGMVRYDRYIVGEKGRKYIRKRDSSAVKALAEKSYYKLKIAEFKAERDKIQEILARQGSFDSPALKYAMQNEDIHELLRDCLEPWSDEVRNWAVEGYVRSREHPEFLRYKTKKGDYVRSKAEMTIADTLFDANIPYRYESRVLIGNVEYYPDFLIMNPKTGKIFILEYLGMLDNDSYAFKNQDKLLRYIKNGYIPSQNLILISETEDRPFDGDYVRAVLRHYFGSFL